MKEESEKEYAAILLAMEKLIINIWKITIKTKNHHIENIGT